MIFRDALDKAKREGSLRTLRVFDAVSGRAAVIGGREVILFASNNYLGLADHPEIKKAAADAIEKHGWGSGASRLVLGTARPHAEFEEKIAAWLSKPASLLFSTGWAANVGTLTAMLGRKDKIFADRLCHASIIDGARYSNSKLIRFAHNDPDSLERLLEREWDGGGKRIVVTEGVFSMDGDIAPLREIAGAAKRHGALLMVDDAHGFGVFGAEGKGAVHEAGIADMVDIHVVTLGKALGGAGGVVLGSREVIDGLINFSRAFMFSTAPPPAAAAAGAAAIDIVRGPEGDKLRRALMTNADRARESLRALGLDTGASASHIIPVIVGSSEKAMEMGERFMDAGAYIPAIRPPAVPRGSARFRVSIMSSHTEKDLEKLAQLFTIVT